MSANSPSYASQLTHPNYPNPHLIQTCYIIGPLGLSHSEGFHAQDRSINTRMVFSAAIYRSARNADAGEAIRRSNSEPLTNYIEISCCGTLDCVPIEIYSKIGIGLEEIARSSAV